MDGCARQNPAYRPATEEAPKGASSIWHPGRVSSTGYIELLGKRQVQVVVGAAIVAGLSVGGPLAIVLMVQNETGSFASAGAVTAAIATAGAITGPVQGRVIDRFGQTRTLVPLSVAAALSSGALVAATLSGAELWVMLACGALIGASSASLLPSMRPLWADLVDHPDQLGTAYAIQAVMTELFFIAGPLAAAALIAVGSPAAAVLALAGARLIGMLAFAATQASRSWRSPTTHQRHWKGALASAGMLTLITADVPFGAMFGTLDVAVPAFAKDAGSASAAGVALAALAVASMIGGLVYGARKRRVDGGRYALLTSLQAALLVPLIFADSLEALVAGMALAGFLVAPVSTVSFGLLDRIAPAGTATEATSWVITSYQVGLAIGTALGGALVQHVGTEEAFIAAFAFVTASAAAVIVGRARLDRVPA